MRFKWPKRFSGPDSRTLPVLALVAGALAPLSATALTVDPAGPNSKVSVGGNSTVYYLSSLAPANVVAAPTFSKIDFSATTLYFNVAGADTAKPYLWIFAADLSNSSFYEVPIAACPTNSGVTGRCDKGTYSAYQFGLNLASICASPLGNSMKGCLAAALDQVTSPPPGLTLYLVESTEAAVGAVASRSSGTRIDLKPQLVGPTLTSCSPAPGFFPGDQAIILDTNAFPAAANSAGSSSAITNLWVVAEKDPGTITAGSEFSASLVRSTGVTSGEQIIGGFENSTSDPAVTIRYNMNVGVQDSAGATTFCTSPAGYTNVFATDIQGFLRESNCFVATASFRSGRAPAVMMLREFRDHVLSRSDLGRSFIGWYYENGPKAADWLIEHPVFRTFALAALIPLQLLAWLALHPLALLLPLGALLLLLAIFARRTLPLLLIAAALIPSARAADQPYIDSLISQLPREETPTKENPEPYIQAQKRKLGPGDQTDGYTRHLKRELAPSDGSEAYTQRLQRGLPPDHGSAIEDYRKGRKLKANKGDPVADSAFGFKMAATANRTYTAGANQDIAYEEVYGSKWIPDFTVHYEKRVFGHDSFLHKLALYGSVGSSFTKAEGVLDVQSVGGGTFPNRSRTDFQFIMLPVNVGLIYRLNFGILFPYFGAGPSVVGMLEKRHDDQPGNRGYSLGYWFTGGAAFGLDFLSRESSWDRYETAQIKHTYLNVDYTYLSAGGLVDLTVDGVSVGFTFEL
jgi:hypothetical protein